ncbi:hypothetical protein HC776_03205 [bacterium]|nr:hypothetical protein [bacterium]
MEHTMPAYAEWVDDNRAIIHMHLHDPWTAAEYLVVSDHVRDMMLAAGYPVHLILNLTHTWHIPKDVLSILPILNKNMLPQQGICVGVRYLPYARALVRFIGRVFPRMTQNLFYAYTLNEAYEIITDYERDYPAVPAARRAALERDFSHVRVDSA